MKPGQKLQYMSILTQNLSRICSQHKYAVSSFWLCFLSRLDALHWNIQIVQVLLKVSWS